MIFCALIAQLSIIQIDWNIKKKYMYVLVLV